MNDTEKHFVGLLAKADLTAETFTKRETARQAGLATMRSELDAMVMTPDGKQVPLRDSIRAGMQFNTVNKKGLDQRSSFSEEGQEEAIDTEAALAKGHGISEKDQARVQEAMDDALALVAKLKAQTGPDGKPLYEDGDLMDEVFTPLMREGLLPDNLILDKYSATNQLLAATFGRYTKSLKDAEKAKQEKSDLNTVDAGGANGKLGTLKALGGKAGEIKNSMQAKMMAKTGLSEDSLRRIKLGGGIAMSVEKFVKSNKTDLEGLVPDFMINDVKDFLTPIEERLDDIQNALNADLQKHAPFLAKPVEALETHVEGLLVKKPDTGSKSPKPSEFKKLLQEVQASRVSEIFDACTEHAKLAFDDEVARNQWLEKVGDILADLAEKIDVKVDSIPHFEQLKDFAEDHSKTFSKMCMGAVEGVVETGGSAVVQGIGIKGVKDSLVKADKEKRLESAVRETVQEIDLALTEAVTAVDPVAGVALSGQFIKRVKVGDVLTAATADPIDGGGVVDAFAAGIEGTFADAAPPSDPPDGTADVFAKMGIAIAAAFRGKASGDQLTKGLKDEPVAALGVVVKAAQAAAAKELGTLAGADDPSDAGSAAEFKKRVKSPANQKGLLAQGAIPDPEDIEGELQKSDEELKGYEDSLILIDEGGMDAAQARNIETLILELQKSRKVLELISGLGQGLIGAGITALKPVADTGLGGPATDVLKIAKMIAQLAVNTKKAADRWILWYKFRSSLGHSKKAVSALTSTIQGFFNNKKEQIAFHTIDDALTAVQIAFTIVGMVPEPITMSIGKTVNLAASGAQVANQIAGKVYDEIMLTKAWNTTLAAMNNRGNRQLGLAALRLNPTLGMHAVAWAGAERQPPDPIARMLMDRLGVSAQTIAAGASGDSVKDYLTELLNEDRQIERSTGMDLDWMPEKFTLCARDFFSITKRASEKATPKLQLGSEKSVLDTLKMLDEHQPDKLAPLAAKGDVPPEELTKQVEEAEAVQKALMTYSPRCEDRTVHEDMSNVQAEFLSLAVAHVNRLEAIEAKNNLVRQQAIDALQVELGAIASMPDDADAPTLTKQIDDSSTVLNDISGRRSLANDSGLKEMVRRLDLDIERLRDRLAAA